MTSCELRNTALKETIPPMSQYCTTVYVARNITRNQSINQFILFKKMQYETSNLKFILLLQISFITLPNQLTSLNLGLNSQELTLSISFIQYNSIQIYLFVNKCHEF